MDPKQRSYSLTEAGTAALANPAAGLSIPCRRILGLLQGETRFAVISAGMAMCAEAQVADWLKRLESLGLLKSKGPDRDLDFTGSLSLAALRAAPKPS